MALQFKIPPKVDLCTHNEADLIETGNLSNSPEDINSEFEQVHFEASNNYKTAAQLQEEFERALAQTQDALHLLRTATNIALDALQLNNEGVIWLPGGLSEMTSVVNRQDETEHTVLLQSVFALLQKQEDEIQQLVDAFNVRVKHANDILLELSSQLESV
eukprot:2356614-Rhodomonas_salina.10